VFAKYKLEVTTTVYISETVKLLHETIAGVLQWSRAGRQWRWKKCGVTRPWGRLKSTIAGCRALVTAWSLTGQCGHAVQK